MHRDDLRSSADHPGIGGSATTRRVERSPRDGVYCRQTRANERREDESEESGCREWTRYWFRVGPGTSAAMW